MASFDNLGLYSYLLPFVILCFGLTVIQYAKSHRNRSYDKGKEKTDHSIKGFVILSKITDFFIITTLILIFFRDSLDWYFFDPSNTFIVGFIVLLIGYFIFHLGKTELGQNYSPCTDQYVPHEYVKTGIYRYLEHPIYVGTSLMLYGITLYSGAWVLIPIAILTSVFQYKSAKKEADFLKERFQGKK